MNAIVRNFPSVTPRSDGLYEVATSWQVSLQDGETEILLTILPGFIFDGASIPRVLWRLCGTPMDAPRVVAALAHDWLYAAHKTSRETADFVYYDLMRAVGIPWWKCVLELTALRWCGGKAWKSHDWEDEDFARAHGVLGIQKTNAKRHKGEKKMKKLAIVAALFAAVAVLTGCATKARDVEVDGMYVSDTGTFAIGSVEVTAAPLGEETVFFKYWEDTAWLSPSTKTRNCRLNLSGTNTTTKIDLALKEVKEILIHDAPAETNAIENVSKAAAIIEGAVNE